MFARRRHRGVVLILVLLLLTLLVVVVGQLTYTTSVDRLLAANQLEDQQVDLALASGIEYARALLAADAGGDARHDAPGEPWSRSWKREVGGVQLEGRISDEERRFNLYLLPDSKQTTALGRVLGAARSDDGEALATTLSAWFGGERALRGELKYAGRSSGGPPLYTLAELTAIDGIDGTALWGAEDEDEDDDATPLVDVLTLWGSGRINLNSASPAVLLALHPKVTPTLAEAVVARRAQDDDGTVTAPFSKVDDLREVEGFDEPIGKAASPDEQPPTLFDLCRARATVTSTAFRLRLSARGARITRSVEVIFRRDGERVAVLQVLPR